MNRRTFTYLSGPITAKCGFTIEENVASAVKVFLDCLQRGLPAFCPHLSGAFPSAFGVDYETWLAYDFAVIERCTHVLMLPRWQTSDGAVREMEYARTLGRSVVFSIDELSQAVAAVDPSVASTGNPSTREAKGSSDV